MDRQRRTSQSIIPPEGPPPTGAGGLYVHIPYCRAKCGYCDFWSVPLAGQDASDTVETLIEEARRRVADFGQPVATVFVGGGTPTALPGRLLERLLAGISDVLQRQAGVEFSVEANPGTLEDGKAGLLGRAGVDRVSLGVQSFDAAELLLLGRIHGPEQIPAAVDELRQAGIANINLDLIFGVCGQTMSSWRETLRRAVELGPTHLACYGLTYEDGTPLTRRVLAGQATPVDEQLEAEMYLAAIETLTAAGFEHYEISNFARPGFRCRHNLGYWSGGPYIGAGPAACGCYGGVRYRNGRDIAEYVRQIRGGGEAAEEVEEITGPMRATELLMLQMRLVEGLDLAEYRHRTTVDLAANAAGSLDRLKNDGLVEVAGGRLRLTRRGLLVGDAVIAELAAALEAGAGEGGPVVQAGKRLGRA